MLLEVICAISELSKNSELSYRPETLKCETSRAFVGSFDLECWRMASKMNRASLLYHFAHHFKAIGEFTLKLRPGSPNSGHNWRFFSGWPWTLTDDLEQQLDTSSWTRPNWSKIYFDFCDLDLWRLTITFFTSPNMAETFRVRSITGGGLPYHCDVYYAYYPF